MHIPEVVMIQGSIGQLNVGGCDVLLINDCFPQEFARVQNQEKIATYLLRNYIVVEICKFRAQFLGQKQGEKGKRGDQALGLNITNVSEGAYFTLGCHGDVKPLTRCPGGLSGYALS